MMTEADERSYAMWLHLSQLANYVIPGPSFLVPVVLWLMKRRDSAEIDRHGRQVINHQIALFLLLVVSAVLCLVLIGFILLPLLGLYALIWPIMNAVRAGDGRPTSYPLSLPIL